MFDSGFSELFLIFIIGLIVLGPKRLPVVIKTVQAWIKTLRMLSSTVQQELKHELNVMELQEKIKKIESMNAENLMPELKTSLETLRQAVHSLKTPFEHETLSEPVIGKIQPEEDYINGEIPHRE